jgi:hypothetical protein
MRRRLKLNYHVAESQWCLADESELIVSTDHVVTTFDCGTVEFAGVVSDDA